MREKKNRTSKYLKDGAHRVTNGIQLALEEEIKKAEPTHVSGFRIFVLLGVLGWAKKLVSFSFVKYEKDNNGVLMRRSKK